MTMDAITILRAHGQELKERFHVRKLGLFGSRATGTSREGSDVDVLVEFEAAHKSFDNYVGLKSSLEEVFGREVDLVMSEAVKPRLKERILRETQYV